MRLVVGSLFSLLLVAWGLEVRPAANQETGQSAVSPSKDDVQAVTVLDEEVAAHRTGKHRPIRITQDDGERPMFERVQLTLVVDRDGNVSSATVRGKATDRSSLAVSEAMSWKYVPFERDGTTVVAKISEYVRVLPPEVLPKVHREFPKITDLAEVVMTLSRSGCFGNCPSYSIEIRGDGAVLFSGESFVVVTGQHRDHLSAEQVSEILDAFRGAEYLSLKNDYSYSATDNPTYTTSLQVGAVSKSVRDYLGLEAGMPQAVSDLEETIDRVSDTTKWIKGNQETVPALKREGWNFKSSQAAEVMARALKEGNTALVQDLLAAGVGFSGSGGGGHSALATAAQADDRVSVDILIKAGADSGNTMMKTEALAAAAQTGDLELVQRLLEYGGDPKASVRDRDGSTTVLMSAVASGVPEVVQMILNAEPDLAARDRQSHTALWYVFGANRNLDQKRHADRAQVAHLLAHAGADLDAQDKDGNTALHSAHDSEIIQALIQDGANVNIRNTKEETPLMTNDSVEIAKLLVAAGAEVNARNVDGKTALDLAEDMEPDGEKVHFLKSLNSSTAVIEP
jgi:ankyrin repeat protein